MRLDKFLIESNQSIKVEGPTKWNMYTISDIGTFMSWWSKVERECKYVLKDLRDKRNSGHRMIWRGIKGVGDTGINKKNIRSDRSPKDSSADWHNAFDNVFKKEFGWKARSEGLFVTGNEGNAKGYGTGCVIFPVGRYTLLWSERINDLYGEIESYNWEESDSWREEKQQEWEEEYGEGGQGSWWWEGNDTGENDMDDAIEWVLNSWREDNEGDYEDEEELEGNMPSEKDIRRELTWEPNMSFDDYMNYQEYEPNDDDYYDAAHDIIVGSGRYKTSGLVDALSHHTNPEIMIGLAKEYYYFADYWAPLVEYALFNPDNPDPRQDKFDFNK